MDLAMAESPMASILYLGGRYVSCNVPLAYGLEQDKNKKEHNVIHRNEPRTMASPQAGRRAEPAARSGLRHLAGRVEGPIAIDPDHAPFDAPGRADQRGILTHRVIDRPF